MSPFFLCNRHYEGDDGDDRASVPAKSEPSDIGLPDIYRKYPCADWGEGYAAHSISTTWGHYGIVASQHSFDAAHTDDGPTGVTIPVTTVTF